jgi:transposase
MLQISPTTRIFICNHLVDFRKGIDGLAAICRSKLNQDPYQGALFLFRNRSQNAIRILMYDGQGFWLCTKRLSKGKFQWWADTEKVDARQLQTLLWNGNPDQASFSHDWRKVGT